MSNSAFTPTQIEVTNEVPVNVPVVTAWETFTPSFAGLGTATFSQNNGYWRRVGDSIEVEVGTVVSTVGSGSTAVSISLPNSLTVDWSKLSEISGSGQPYSIVGVGNINTATYNTCTVIARQDVGLVFAKQAGGNLIGSELTPSTTQFSFKFKIPVAEWAGSGTTTLATRAVEEYAFNTSTSTTTSDISSFGYGPSGVQIQNITASLTRRVRFQTPIQATDKFCLEVSINRINWQDVSYRFGDNSTSDIVQLTRQLTATYGVGYIVPVNSTDIDVTFGQYAEPASAAYGSAGRAWSAGAGSWYWRIRKVSGGAQVGYPVSARNIVGDTSGSVVPVGMLGEQVLFTTRSVSAVTPNWVANTSPLITLTPGTWILFPQITGIAAAGLTSVLAFLSTDSNSNSTGNLSLENGAFVLAANATINQSDIPMAMIYLNVTQNTPIYAKARTSGANTTITLKGRAVRIA